MGTWSLRGTGRVTRSRGIGEPECLSASDSSVEGGTQEYAVEALRNKWTGHFEEYVQLKPPECVDLLQIAMP